ncbi:MAG: excisionase family DNA-binding protein [Candidatus Omnitrophota bacterium]|nr:excisionase family DNA-binding protein [Candidatus Omnitrophota bacterium]
MNNMLTLEEVKSYLAIQNEVVEKYIKSGRLTAYKIGGTYIRFRKEEVLVLRQEASPKKRSSKSQTLFSRIGDFWRFNNFYILSILIIIGIVVFVIRT